MFAAGADGNGSDRWVFTWRDCVLAEAVGQRNEHRRAVGNATKMVILEDYACGL